MISASGKCKYNYNYCYFCTQRITQLDRLGITTFGETVPDCQTSKTKGSVTELSSCL